MRIPPSPPIALVSLSLLAVPVSMADRLRNLPFHSK